MTWICKQHGATCRSYVQADIDSLNADNVKPDDNSIREWYKKKYPHMAYYIEDEISYIHTMLEWVDAGDLK